jgi:hypothetical protein
VEKEGGNLLNFESTKKPKEFDDFLSIGQNYCLKVADHLVDIQK